MVLALKHFLLGMAHSDQILRVSNPPVSNT
jgi:hypothetical protein